jgi:hypothetical protein
VSISQPPAQGRGKSGAKAGAGPGRPPSTNGRKAGSTTQAPGANRQSGPKNNSQKTAGNRQVNAKTAAQRTAGRPGDRQKQSGGGRPGAPRGRSGPAPVQIPSRRPSPTVLGLGAVGVVIVVVLVIVLVGVSKSPGKQLGPVGGRAAAPPSLVKAVTSVPESVFVKVGLPSEITNYPKKVTGQSPLTDPGLPEFLFVGAEYCPFCAAERWAMVMALSKFGTFSNLQTTFSSVTDFAPDTATFSFHGSTYTSKYLAFRPYEVATNEQAATGATCNVNGYACLDTIPTVAGNLWQKIGNGTFPFMDFGNKVMQAGAGFENQPLALQGLDASQIAAQLTNPSSAVAQAEDGSANYLTAGICAMTGNTPSDVCSAPYVKTAEKKAGISS